MKYRVKIRVSYCETFFDFDEAIDACNFMATAAEHLTGEGDKTSIGLAVITEEAEA